MSRNTIATKRLNFLRKPLQIIRANFRAYLIINAIVYGLVIAGFVAALIFPNLGVTQVATLEDNGTGDLVRSLIKNPWLFALTILGVNVFRVGVLSIVPLRWHRHIRAQGIHYRFEPSFHHINRGGMDSALTNVTY